MANIYKVTILILLMMSNILLAESSEDYIQMNYDFLEKKDSFFDYNNTEILPNKYKAIVTRSNDKLCIKAKTGDVCFKNEGAGDNIQRYNFLGMMPNNKVAIVRFMGYEEFFDYFISLDTGHIVLTLPSIYNGFIQTSISPEQRYMLVVTTNNGYDGDAYLTEIEILSLVERTTEAKICDESNNYFNMQNISCNPWLQEMGLVFKEQDEGPHTYNISWLDNTTVKIQSLTSNKDYIIFHQVESGWQTKEKSYHSWSDYVYQESN